MKIVKVFGILLVSSFYIACNGNAKKEKLVKEAAQDLVEQISEEKHSFNEVIPEKLAELNTAIASKNLKTNEEIARFYVPEATEIEGNYTYTLSEVRVSVDEEKVTVIEDNLMDDSHLAQKVVIYIATKGSVKEVKQIKTAYKCRQERGHATWSAEPCR